MSRRLSFELNDPENDDNKNININIAPNFDFQDNSNIGNTNAPRRRRRSIEFIPPENDDNSNVNILQNFIPNYDDFQDNSNIGFNVHKRRSSLEFVPVENEIVSNSNSNERDVPKFKEKKEDDDLPKASSDQFVTIYSAWGNYHLFFDYNTNKPDLPNFRISGNVIKNGENLHGGKYHWFGLTVDGSMRSLSYKNTCTAIGKNGKTIFLDDIEYVSLYKTN
eukprot:TRINITY_DN4578_c0_g1_i1.p1 TRINITY_DN4578_c0_g1~~TRINITY_DN4578_c0_g1_i1.p1  ORF type:complete len:221 (-),score=68.55 TRINITY_DN4578_c0_g1_i1:509-1171(-)